MSRRRKKNQERGVKGKCASGTMLRGVKEKNKWFILFKEYFDEMRLYLCGVKTERGF